VDIDACTTYNLAQTSPSRPLNRAEKRAKNRTISNTAGTLTHSKVAATRDFFMKTLLHFCKFLVSSKFDLATKYIFKNRFQ